MVLTAGKLRRGLTLVKAPTNNPTAAQPGETMVIRCRALLFSSVLIATVTVRVLTVSADGDTPTKRGRWVDIGPAPIHGGQIGLTGNDRPVTGRVSAVAVDPGDGQHWLVGGAQGGVWETTNGGHTWRPLTDGQPSLATGAITFGPRNPDLVYVGTGEALGAFGAFPGRGLLKLTRDRERGAWTIGVMTRRENDTDHVPFVRLGFSSIVVDPNDSDHLMVATRRVGRDLYGGSTPEGVESERGIVEITRDGLARHIPGDATDLKVHPAPEKFRCMFAGITRTRTLNKPPTIGVYRRGGAECETGGTAAKGSYVKSGTCPIDPAGGQWMRIGGPWDDRACELVDKRIGTQGNIADRAGWQSFMGRIRIAIGKNPNVVYVSIARRTMETSSQSFEETEGGGLLGLWRTDNAWASSPNWVRIPVGAVDGGTGEFGYCGAHPSTSQDSLCHWSHVLSIDPSDDDTLYAGGIGLWKAKISCRRSDGVVTACDAVWTDVSQITPPDPPRPRLRRRGIHVDQHAMAWTPDRDRLIVGNDGGVWSTTTAGRTWNEHNAGLSVVQFYRGDVGETPSGSKAIIVAGTQDNGTVRWVDQRWEWLVGGDGGPVVIARDKPETHWAVASKSVLFGERVRRTKDGGKEFTFANGGFKLGAEVLLMPLVGCQTANDVVLLAGGTQRLMKSPAFFTHRAAPTWSDNLPGALTLKITAIAFASGQNCKTYAIGLDRDSQAENAFVLVTSNGGKGWCRLDGLPLGRISGLAFKPNEPTTLYASVWETRDETEDGARFGVVGITTKASCPKTKKGLDQTVTDANWRRIDLPDALPSGERRLDARENIRTLAVHPLEADTIWVGTDAGIWVSTATLQDGKRNWVRHDHREFGMPNVAVFDIKITPKTGQVVALTYGRGAFLWTEERKEAISAGGGGWCEGKASAVVGTNFLSCLSQQSVRARREILVNDGASSP
jgi:hypothetical protein